MNSMSFSSALPAASLHVLSTSRLSPTFVTPLLPPSSVSLKHLLPKHPSPSVLTRAAEREPLEGERFLSLEDIVAEAFAGGTDFVFTDDGESEDDNLEDPFKGGSAMGQSGSSTSSGPEVLPSIADVKNVVSAYNSAPPTTENVSVEELKKLLEGESPPLVVDVRSHFEYSSGHVPGALNVPLPEIVPQILSGAVPLEGRQLVLICQAGGRSARAALEVEAAIPEIKKIINVVGGTGAWIGNGYQVEK